MDRLGIALDRRWMVINAQNRFVTAREYSNMTLIKPSFNQNFELVLNAPNMPTLVVPDVSQRVPLTTLEVEVWKDKMKVALLTEECHAWVSRFLGGRL